MNINLTLLAKLIDAYKNCIKKNNTIWADTHKEAIDILCQHLPNGSGIDTGTQLDIDNSTNKRIVFNLSFHHLNENGYYTNWTNHSVIVTPEFGSFDIKITGRNSNYIKEYLNETFSNIFII